MAAPMTELTNCIARVLRPIIEYTTAIMLIIPHADACPAVNRCAIAL